MKSGKRFITTLLLVAILNSIIVPVAMYKTDGAVAGQINSSSSHKVMAEAPASSNTGIQPAPGRGGDLQGIWGWIKKHVLKPVISAACEIWPEYIPEVVCEWANHQDEFYYGKRRF